MCAGLNWQFSLTLNPHHRIRIVSSVCFLCSCQQDCWQPGATRHDTWQISAKYDNTYHY